MLQFQRSGGSWAGHLERKAPRAGWEIVLFAFIMKSLFLPSDSNSASAVHGQQGHQT